MLKYLSILLISFTTLFSAEYMISNKTVERIKSTGEIVETITIKRYNDKTKGYYTLEKTTKLPKENNITVSSNYGVTYYTNLKGDILTFEEKK